MKDRKKEVEEYVRSVRSSKHSDFYKKIWGAQEVFSELPAVSRGDFLQTPLSARRYKEEKSLVKIVHSDDSAFLSEWAFSDIGRESWGIPSKRPMVYMSDAHEALEKCVWCYERGMVPLIGELDADIAMYAAERYRIDSLITDAAALAKITSYLMRRDAQLDSITVIGNSFEIGALAPFAAFTKRIRLLLAFPETGAFAEGDISGGLRFSALPECIIEKNDGDLLLTKQNPLVTPIIRYRLGIPADHIIDA